jgi:hypothetical protein
MFQLLLSTALNHHHNSSNNNVHGLTFKTPLYPHNTSQTLAVAAPPTEAMQLHPLPHHRVIQQQHLIVQQLQ